MYTIGETLIVSEDVRAGISDGDERSPARSVCL
jgi:hypothetical protein